MPASSAHVFEIAPRERRSLFGNFRPHGADGSPSGPPGPAHSPVRRDPAEVASARCFLHQFLARALEHPSEPTWAWLTDPATSSALLRAAAATRPEDGGGLERAASALGERLVPAAFGDWHDAYVSAIGHAARGSSPINEIEYGELRADPLFQPHRLADLAAFYRAFGVEVCLDGGERHDHLSVELEFMAVLTGQEARWLEEGGPGADEALAVNLAGQEQFLREHLGRWVPALGRRLKDVAADPGLRAAVDLLLAFVAEECRRAGVLAGSADVTLRPADEGAALCDSCGLAQRVPGSDGE